MNKKIAFVAAPYGFGPTSKAIAIASHLPPGGQCDFFGAGPALELASNTRLFDRCVRLQFDSKENTEHASSVFSEYHCVVFINTTRFIPLIKPQTARVIFVDTLAWLRERPPNITSNCDIYFAQRFFLHRFSDQLIRLKNFRPVGSITPRPLNNLTTHSGKFASEENIKPFIHCGGLHSPAMVRGADCHYIECLIEFLSLLEIPVRLALPSYIYRTPDISKHGLIEIIDCLPTNIERYLSISSIAISTSGIEFSYEALSLQVPLIFLPPFNATQYLQLLHHREIHSKSIPFDLVDYEYVTFDDLDKTTKDIQNAGYAGEWRRQFKKASSMISSDLKSIYLKPDTYLSAQLEAARKAGKGGAEEIAAELIFGLQS